MSDDFNYAVAFSFTEPDEKLAYTLYNLLKGRLNCFIYSEEQKKLAGSDGETLFNNVYSKEARIVVILYRKEYGKTKWTRIEETAIRNRGYDEGYDFLILIPTEHSITPPKWLPKNRLWVGLERWGIESAAGVIEARVQEYGGTIKIETLTDVAVRMENEIQDKLKRKQLLASTEALAIANSEVIKLKDIFKELQKEITTKTEGWSMRFRENKHKGVDILSYGYILYFHFYQQYANTLTDAYLFIVLYKGYFDDHGNVNDPFSENIVIDSAKLTFDINELDQNGWSIRNTKRGFLTTQKLADKWFTKFLEFTGKARQERN